MGLNGSLILGKDGSQVTELTNRKLTETIITKGGSIIRLFSVHQHFLLNLAAHI